MYNRQFLELAQDEIEAQIRQMPDKLCLTPCPRCQQPCHNLDVPHFVHTCLNSHAWTAKDAALATTLK
jgi:hypothetical protein